MDKALQFYQEDKDMRGAAKTYMFLGDLEKRGSQSRAVSNAYAQSLELFKKIGDVAHSTMAYDKLMALYEDNNFAQQYEKIKNSRREFLYNLKN